MIFKFISDEGKKATLKKYVIYIIAGASAGFINGFLGTGGGIILLFALPFAEKGGDIRNRFAETLAVTLVFSAVSAVMYYYKGKLVIEGIGIYAIPAVFGGAIGAYLLDRISPKVTKKIFAVLVAAAGVIMIVRR